MAGDFSICCDVPSCLFIAIKCIGVCFKALILDTSILTYGQSKEISDCCLAKETFGIKRASDLDWPVTQKTHPYLRVGSRDQERLDMVHGRKGPRKSPRIRVVRCLYIFLSLKSGLSTQTSRQDALRATSNQVSKGSSARASNGKCRPETFYFSPSVASLQSVLHHKDRLFFFFFRETGIMPPLSSTLPLFNDLHSFSVFLV